MYKRHILFVLVLTASESVIKCASARPDVFYFIDQGILISSLTKAEQSACITQANNKRLISPALESESPLELAAYNGQRSNVQFFLSVPGINLGDSLRCAVNSHQSTMDLRVIKDLLRVHTSDEDKKECQLALSDLASRKVDIKSDLAINPFNEQATLALNNELSLVKKASSKVASHMKELTEHKKLFSSERFVWLSLITSTQKQYNTGLFSVRTFPVKKARIEELE